MLLRRRSHVSRVACGLVFASAVAIPNRAPAVIGPGDVSLLQKADDLERAGKFRESAQAYAEYYRRRPPAKRASPDGANDVTYAADMFHRAWERDADLDDLKGERAILAAFVADLEHELGASDQPFAANIKTRLQGLERQLRQLEPAPAAIPAEPAKVAQPQPAPEVLVPASDPQVPATPDDSTRPSPKDRLGLGLVIGGSVVTLGGVGLMAAGPTIYAQAENEVDGSNALEDDRCPGAASASNDADCYLDQAADLRRAYLISGGVVMAVGVAAVVWGAVRLARRRSKARLSGHAWFDERGAGGTIRLRF